MDHFPLTAEIVSGRKGITIRSDGARPALLRATVRAQAQRLAEIGTKHEAAADRQVSVTYPDALSMATNGRGTGIVSYKVRTAVDTKRHLIVEHEGTNLGHGRTPLKAMARCSRDVMDGASLTVPAGRGCFSGEQIAACEQAGSKADGRFDKGDFIYEPGYDGSGRSLPSDTSVGSG